MTQDAPSDSDTLHVWNLIIETENYEDVTAEVLAEAGKRKILPRGWPQPLPGVAVRLVLGFGKDVYRLQDELYSMLDRFGYDEVTVDVEIHEDSMGRSTEHLLGMITRGEVHVANPIRVQNALRQGIKGQ